MAAVNMPAAGQSSQVAPVEFHEMVPKELEKKFNSILDKINVDEMRGFLEEHRVDVFVPVVVKDGSGNEGPRSILTRIQAFADNMDEERKAAFQPMLDLLESNPGVTINFKG